MPRRLTEAHFWLQETKTSDAISFWWQAWRSCKGQEQKPRRWLSLPRTDGHQSLCWGPCLASICTEPRKSLEKFDMFEKTLKPNFTKRLTSQREASSCQQVSGNVFGSKHHLKQYRNHHFQEHSSSAHSSPQQHSKIAKYQPQEALRY